MHWRSCLSQEQGKRDAPALPQPASSCAFGLGDSARTHDVTAARELVRIAAAKRVISRMAMALKESGWRSYSILRRSRECARMGHKCPTCSAIARQLLLIDARSSRKPQATRVSARTLYRRRGPPPQLRTNFPSLYIRTPATPGSSRWCDPGWAPTAGVHLPLLSRGWPVLNRRSLDAC